MTPRLGLAAAPRHALQTPAESTRDRLEATSGWAREPREKRREAKCPLLLTIALTGLPMEVPCFRSYNVY